MHELACLAQGRSSWGIGNGVGGQQNQFHIFAGEERERAESEGEGTRKCTRDKSF